MIHVLYIGTRREMLNCLAMASIECSMFGCGSQKILAIDYILTGMGSHQDTCRHSLGRNVEGLGMNHDESLNLKAPVGG